LKWNWYSLDRRQYIINILISMIFMFIMAFFAHIMATAGMQIIGVMLFTISIPIIFWQIGPRIVKKYVKPSPL